MKTFKEYKFEELIKYSKGKFLVSGNKDYMLFIRYIKKYEQDKTGYSNEYKLENISLTIYMNKHVSIHSTYTNISETIKGLYEPTILNTEELIQTYPEQVKLIYDTIKQDNFSHTELKKEDIKTLLNIIEENKKLIDIYINSNKFGL